MMKQLVLALMILLASTGRSPAESKEKPAPPRPAIVVVADTVQGEAQPMTEFVGTVFFARVSEVASEVEGRVEAVHFKEGETVRSGAVLVQLNTDLIDIGIRRTSALHEEARVELEDAREDLTRMETLYRGKSVSTSAYDDTRFRVMGLEKKVVTLRAGLDRERLIKRKMAIRAPFDGIAIQRDVEPGEWASPGTVVGVIAMDRDLDVVVDVPETILAFLEPGREVPVLAGGQSVTGHFSVVIPRGNVATRTFSIKIRLSNGAGLIEGMAARVELPSGPRIDGLLVPRDAVINQFGQDVIFVDGGGAAKMVPVKVLGYQGLMAGVAGPGLEPGMKVVIKGHERLRSGQPLKILTPQPTPEKE
jgi:RND family efflux transporter MFP subunit